MNREGSMRRWWWPYQPTQRLQARPRDPFPQPTAPPAPSNPPKPNRPQNPQHAPTKNNRPTPTSNKIQKQMRKSARAYPSCTNVAVLGRNSGLAHRRTCLRLYMWVCGVGCGSVGVGVLGG